MTMEQKAPLSNRRKRMLRRDIAKQKADEAKARVAAGLPPEPPKAAPARTPTKEVDYIEPIPADGDTVVHDVGISGRPIAVRLDPLHKLRRAGRISEEQYRAGEAYLAIVQAFFVAGSGLSKIDNDVAGSLRNADPIRLYVKGRRKYVPTQKPRIIATPRTSFDGWSSGRSDAMEALGRVRRALRGVEGDALRALYALTIHPNDPTKRPTTLRLYVERQYGYRNQLTEDRVVDKLKIALNALWKEFEGAIAVRKAA